MKDEKEEWSDFFTPLRRLIVTSAIIVIGSYPFIWMVHWGMRRGDIIGEGLAWVSLIGVCLLGRFFLNYIRDCEHIQERRQKEKERRLAPKMRGDKPYW
jgi:hypothetical protein